MLRNLTIRTLVVLLVLFGIIGSVLVAQFDLRAQRDRMDALDRLSQSVEFAIDLGALVNSLQRERGAGAIFLASKGTKFATELKAQRATTDDLLIPVQNAIEFRRAHGVRETISAPFDALSGAITELSTIRRSVDLQELTVGEELAFYSGLNRSAIELIGKFAGEVSDGQIAEDIVVYSALMLAVDYAGVERAMGGALFATGLFEGQARTDFRSIVASQTAFFAFVSRFAATPLREELARRLEGPSAQTVQNMRGILETGDPQQIEAVSAKLWFETISKKIGELKEVERLISSQLLEQAQILYQDANSVFRWHVIWISIVLATILIASLLIYRSVSQSFAEIVVPLADLAKGDLDVVLPKERKNEFGEMVCALKVFHKNELKRLDNQEEIAGQQRAQSVVLDAMQCSLKLLATGDLRAQIATPFDEQYEPLRADYNHAVKQLDGAISSLKPSSEAVGRMAYDLKTSAENLAERTEHQAATLEESVVAMEQINQGVRSAAKHASETNDVMSKTRLDAEKSGEIASEAVASITSLQHSSAQISEIVKTIDDIAFQTNLLALNAGVEAARAGTAGSGFAVVASEVRALAVRSGEAAKEINSLITVSQNQVSDSVEIVGRAVETINDIIGQVSNVSELMNDIAEAAEQQATSLEEVNIGMTQMDNVTQANAGMVVEAKGASESMSSEVEKLQSLISAFMTSLEDKIAGGELVEMHFQRAS